MPLTDTSIKKAKPQGKPLKLFDGGGLDLQINPNGSKWWRLKYYHHSAEGGGISFKVEPAEPINLQQAAVVLMLKPESFNFSIEAN